jgi:hypothetical protein
MSLNSYRQGPLGKYGIAQSLIEMPGWDPLKAQQGEMMPDSGAGGGGFGMSFGEQQPQRINSGFADKDYVGFNDHYTGAGRRGAGSYGFGGSNYKIEAYKKMTPAKQKEFTDSYMANNRYSNVTMGSKWAKPEVAPIAPLASRVVVGGRGRGGRGGVTRPTFSQVRSGRGRAGGMRRRGGR